MHLGHEICPVDFDRTRADAEIEGNLLVGMAGNQAFKNVALAAGEAGEPRVDLRVFGVALVIPLFSRYCGAHGREQQLVIEGFLEKIGRGAV